MKILFFSAILLSCAGPALAADAFKPDDIYALSLVTDPVVAPDGKRIYVTASASNTIYVFSADTQAVLAKIPLTAKVKPRPHGIAIVDR